MAELFINRGKYLLEFFKFICDFVENLSAAQQSFKYYNISLCLIFEMASTVVRKSEIRKWRFKFSNGFYGRLKKMVASWLHSLIVISREKYMHMNLQRENFEKFFFSPLNNGPSS